MHHQVSATSYPVPGDHDVAQQIPRFSSESSLSFYVPLRLNPLARFSREDSPLLWLCVPNFPRLICQAPESA